MISARSAYSTSTGEQTSPCLGYSHMDRRRGTSRCTVFIACSGCYSAARHQRSDPSSTGHWASDLRWPALIAWIASLLLTGCGYKSLPDALPVGLDEDGIASAIAGQWTCIGYADEPQTPLTWDISFTFKPKPSAGDHGTFTRIKGAYGSWKIREARRMADGTYAGRLAIHDDRDDALSLIANGINNALVEREFAGLTKNRYFEKHYGRWTEWRRDEPPPRSDTTGLTSQDLGSTPVERTVTLVKYAPSYLLTVLSIAAGFYAACRPPRRPVTSDRK